jgi:hypothetical protein
MPFIKATAMPEMAPEMTSVFQIHTLKLLTLSKMFSTFTVPE